jgi:hypothetical protein
MGGPEAIPQNDVCPPFRPSQILGVIAALQAVVGLGPYGELRIIINAEIKLQRAMPIGQNDESPVRSPHRWRFRIFDLDPTRRNSSRGLAMFPAIRRASSKLSRLVADLRLRALSRNRHGRLCYDENGEGGFTSDLSTSVFDFSFFASFFTFLISFLDQPLSLLRFLPGHCVLLRCSANDFNICSCPPNYIRDLLVSVNECGEVDEADYSCRRRNSGFVDEKR